MRYTITIFWDETDACYIADVSELPGCLAHGDTYDEALTQAKEAIGLWLDTAREFGDPIPEPKRRMLEIA